ncbi:divalent metal cation transporter [Neolewinella lacunae]|uniref:Divalent metal cation transporter n=1 Tax=Neolewinella lacunae TaxID=1517758 RepID=A0A923PQW7_9BACT|nr:divalent metal cation transporter [Neolewinella lacunae]MBC6995839.1 divalent metal cation transporter [Neolewinella lacunae]MDN3636468.1 divalent metal cation transporter [Neolewinella lacunae]
MKTSSWSRALLWSLIAAAFIGPGTVTTAARAGSEGGWHYTGFVLLAAGAGFVLLEMVARLTLVSGRSLGQILGERGKWLALLCFGAVFLGCVAYQAGNLLGALGGVQLLFPAAGRWLVISLGLVAAVLLWPGEARGIARALAGVVALLGLCFLLTAGGLVLGGERLTGQGGIQVSTVLALLGTTIVPYNFFLAAGLGRGQQLSEMRLGLGLSFGVGALITLGIILVGSLASSFTTFADLARTLDARLGDKGNVVLGFGLFAAGFSSAITAPYAAALAGRELLALGDAERLGVRSSWFRATWLTVLGAGVVVGLLELDIITVIFAAQVANGLLLPFVAGLALVMGNDRALLGVHVNTRWQNLAAWLIAILLAQKTADFLLAKVGITEPFLSFLVAGLYALLLVWLALRRKA